MLEAGDGGGAEAKAQQLNDLSNQFYTLIPHRLMAPPSHPHRRLIASPSDRTLIPHSLGTADMRMPDPTAACPIRRQRSALLDTVEVVMKKVEMIKKLLDLEATVTLLGDGAPADVIVRTEWARLLGAGWLDADARPDAAAAVAGAAWECARVGLGLGFSRPGDEGTRAAAYEAMGSSTEFDLAIKDMKAAAEVEPKHLKKYRAALEN